MRAGNDTVMWHRLFQLDPSGDTSLQRQLREQLVAAILDGRISAEHPLPSSRELSRQLHVSRNTVVLAYEQLIDEGFLVARERRGYFVNPDILRGRVGPQDSGDEGAADSIDWEQRFAHRVSRYPNIEKPSDWRDFPYPFVYGQPDTSLIPVNDWRECVRQSLSVSSIHSWSPDVVNHDDPSLVEQICQRVLPRRGMWASPDEVLVTLGAQNAVKLVSALLHPVGSVVGVENPGYPDARHMFSLHGGDVRPLEVDGEGVVVDDNMQGCHSVFVTPSHQSPTTVTMSLARRQALLERAEADDFIVIEDDYECETNYIGEPTPALKSLDKRGRVIYVGSLTKTFAPGLRLGFLVADKAVVRELRALRRLMYRHPPTNNQRTAAFFLSLGHHDSLVSRLHSSYRERWEMMGEALGKYLPNSARAPSFGGTAFWVTGPAQLDARELMHAALEKGVVIEPGEVFFAQENPPKNCFRLGFSSIAVDKIDEGVRLISVLIDQQLNT